MRPHLDLMQERGLQGLLLTAPARLAWRRALEPGMPNVVVLSTEEIAPGVGVREVARLD